MKNYRVIFPKEAATAQIAMTALGHFQYRLEETPVLLEEELYFHDVIEARGGFQRGLEFQRLIKRSGLRVFEFLLPQAIAESEALQRILRQVVAEGGLLGNHVRGLSFYSFVAGLSI